jgi:hypothetical protein
LIFSTDRGMSSELKFNLFNALWGNNVVFKVFAQYYV